MPPVTGIDDADVRRGMLGEEMGCPAVCVAHDEHITVHGLETVQRIEQAFPLGRCVGADIEIEDLG